MTWLAHYVTLTLADIKHDRSDRAYSTACFAASLAFVARPELRGEPQAEFCGECNKRHPAKNGDGRDYCNA